MKKLLLLALVITFASFTNAQTLDKQWSLGLGVGPYGTINDGGLGLMPEIYFGKYLSPKFDLVLKSNFGLFRSGLENTLDILTPSLNLKYKLSDESKNFRPYLYAGPGMLWDNSETGLNFNAGIGGKFYFSPATALYLDAGYINGIETIRETEKVTDNIWKATIGLEFDFGKVSDSDMDGVSDKKDKCPNTPTGVAVDEDGCPIDTDGDGVADYIDDCPTVAGLTSLKGCPDTDKDGIADKDDACPEVAGLASLKGCPDSDGDGVADKDDKCPDTPKGYKVDAAGCPLDQDNDGVVDAEDDCPTVAGPKENKGCPVVEKTAEEIEAENMKVEPVYFDTNKSVYIDGEKAKIDKVVALLKQNENYKVNIKGYADAQGADNYNLNLSNNRTRTVVNAIIKSGINKKRIATTKGFGETNPASTNDTEEGRSLNRRVEFEIVK